MKSTFTPHTQWLVDNIWPTNAGKGPQGPCVLNTHDSSLTTDIYCASDDWISSFDGDTNGNKGDTKCM